MPEERSIDLATWKKMYGGRDKVKDDGGGGGGRIGHDTKMSIDEKDEEEKVKREEVTRTQDDNDDGTAAKHTGGLSWITPATPSTPPLCYSTSSSGTTVTAGNYNKNDSSWPPTPRTPLKLAEMQIHEYGTFTRMLETRLDVVISTILSKPSNVLKFPIPWTPAAWEHAIRYPDIVEGYHALERRIDEYLSEKFFDLRNDITALPRDARKGTVEQVVFTMKSDELDRVIMRCRLSDSVRIADRKEGVCPPRIPEDLFPLLSELHYREEREVKAVVEEKEQEVADAIKMLEEIGEFAGEEENVPPIVSGFYSAFETRLKRWPELRMRLEKAAMREREKFPKRYWQRWAP
ncbi:hypothetical protein DM02DRAFT_634201 [Periconia macrospinosa]|uniref:Uncharacterized protein n=1 Tax=Periconia macrospinosa TaxID=97972 RepID=A0A2V1D6T0_9PLEO|nr:hypothetical protein DM02DRAFT_634201 [Periconia macrospinosa]